MKALRVLSLDGSCQYILNNLRDVADEIVSSSSDFHSKFLTERAKLS